MAEPTDMIMPMLREMREETQRGFQELRHRMDSRFDGLDARLSAVEKVIKAQREALEAESILGRYAVREVEERLSRLEQKVEALERRE
jgi:hypothetical protein